METTQLPPLSVQVLTISRSDRWQAYERLQSLDIRCHCFKNGSLVAEINSPIAILQLRSVAQQLTASRQELLDWLERCWQVS